MIHLRYRAVWELSSGLLITDNEPLHPHIPVEELEDGHVHHTEVGPAEPAAPLYPGAYS